MRLSLQSLLLFFAAFAVCMALAQTDIRVGAAILVVILIGLNIFLSAALWRHLAYSAIFGMVMALIMCSYYGGIMTGFIRANTYAQMNGVAKVTNPLRPYIIPVGAFLGGTGGLLIYRMKRNGYENSQGQEQ